MPPEQIEKERQAFEAWLVEVFQFDGHELTKDKYGIYDMTEASDKWDGWIARAEQEQKAAWINVNDMLPQVGKTVVVAYERRGDMEYYTGELVKSDNGLEWIVCDEVGYSIQDVLFWQPCVSRAA